MSTTKNISETKKINDDVFFKDLEKQFGEGAIQRIEPSGLMSIERYATGILSLDLALGGGVPKGRLIEIYGNEASGKTTMALQIIRAAQKKDSNLRALFVDSEYALDPKYCVTLGIDLKRFFLAQPQSAESALELIDKVAREGSVKLIVLDSVASLVPRSEIESNMGDSTVASLARVMSLCLKKLVSAITTGGCTIIFLNQLRSNVSTFSYGANETTAGGRALRYFATLRMELSRSALIKRDDKVIGMQTRAKITKNKVYPPFAETMLTLYFGTGFSEESDILNMAVEKLLVSRAGSYFSYGEIKLGRSKEGAIEYLVANPDIRNELEEKIRNAHIS